MTLDEAIMLAWNSRDLFVGGRREPKPTIYEAFRIIKSNWPNHVWITGADALNVLWEAAGPRALDALFHLDQTGEATGTVEHFCNDICFYRAQIENRGQIAVGFKAIGISADWVDGSVCDRCGTALRERSGVTVPGVAAVE